MRAEALPSRLARSIAFFLATVLGGIGIINLGGILWLATVSNISVVTAMVGSLAFVPGDLIKAVLAVLVVQRVDALLTMPRL
jgi:biotin transport system substrate-specific component